MNKATPPPPGWYEDPNGSPSPRWWNGESWGPLQLAQGNGFETSASDLPYSQLNPTKKSSAIPSLILSILAFVVFAEPMWTLVLGLLSLFLAFRILKNKEALSRTRFMSKLAIGIVVLAFSFSFLSVVTGPSPESSREATGSDVVQSSEEKPFDPTEFKELGERDYALLAKNPLSQQGEKLLVYGVVTQFDSNTGTCAFRADTAAVPHTHSYEYDENTFISGVNTSVCNYLEDNVIAGDQFRAWVQVDGVLDYETQIGGNTTALKLNASHLEITDNVN